ncbi:NAD(P)-dependent alcohol dehydrogenase [Brevibacillus sp. M2.1A]|uniref:NAD(P)-dependent alcohol dehydrogenase n=1 Tax=Brevibacillus sp. M2.1A TaxID=2738980 RepID=UPI00156B1A05|nr:NAD(P)-dependent alcohol dehydrogenase [Brevibacillus sp. M2.1A]MCC8438534.1 NAD(P)-dependent alcohol dehydrogenase [Brevibacillus sp. M2.1A]
MKITAAVIHQKEEAFKIEQIEITEPQANEVLIRVVATGVCHTDAVARDQGLAPFPVVLGHEGAGIVEKVGVGVKHVEPGDHVVISYASCGHCENCLTGHPSTCVEFNQLNFGGEMEDGSHRLHQHEHELSTFFGQSSFATYAIANERNVVKVDKDVDLALLGPLGCGIQTGSGTVLNKLRPSFGSSIAVYGCGAVGLSAIMAAKIAGCKEIIAIDVHDSRLELAKELGATLTLNGKNVDVVKEIKAATGGGANYAVETTGVPPVVRQSLQALRPLGISAIVGITPEMSIDVHNDIMVEGKTMIGVIEGDAVPQLFIPQLVEYYKRGMFPFDKLVKFYDFHDINKAFEDSKAGITIKPVLKISEITN